MTAPHGPCPRATTVRSTNDISLNSHIVPARQVLYDPISQMTKTEALRGQECARPVQEQGWDLHELEYKPHALFRLLL